MNQDSFLPGAMGTVQAKVGHGKQEAVWWSSSREVVESKN